jgi:eukaryotic-like serine/threonine-protein kinase
LPKLVEKLPVHAGQGELWLARSDDDPFGVSDIVVKYLTINSDPTTANKDRRRFAREVRCQSLLGHVAIMPILQFNLEDERPWYSMPRADATLDDVLDKGTVLTPAQMLPIIWTVMNAVEFAHNEGVLHRDLKPANILHLPGASQENTGWVVADFGLCRDRNSKSSRITQVRTRVGTVEYMAPEQFDDAHQVGVTADIFALGRVIAHCLTGRVPFPTIRWPDLPDIFRAVVRRCVAEDPAERYQSINALRSDIVAVMAGGEQLVNPISECRRLLGVAFAANHSPESIHSLADWFTANGSDEQLHVQMVAELQHATIQSISQQCPEQSSAIFRNFDRFTSGSFPFSFTDTIARFFESVYLSTSDELLQRVALRRILLVGYTHHRFYPRDTFCRLASTATGPAVVMISSLIREEPDAASFIAEVGLNYSFAPMIKDAILGSAKG